MINPWTVLDPSSGAAAVSTELVARPASFAGLVVGCLDNGKPNTDRFLAQLFTHLQQEGIRHVVLVRKPNIGRLAPRAMLDELAERCDVVVTGVGDCAGCCSCTVQDGIALERRGIPTYVVCTSEFHTTARISATAAGAPNYPFSVMPHPLGSLTPELLAERALAAYRAMRTAPA